MLFAMAIVFVVLLWGLSTAAIFYVDSLAPRTFPRSMAVATGLLVICAAVIWHFRNNETDWAIAASFAAALLTWGYTEMALYMGFVTGPRKKRCPENCAGAEHFGHAVAANLWHEILVVAFATAIWFTGNSIATWCFIMLWLMHLSARLNVFLGVRNISEEFVPKHMDVLKGFLRKRNMNALFPFSVAVLIGFILLHLEQPMSFASMLAATLATIGLLEHVLLMLPLPIEKLFRWSLSSAHRQDTAKPAFKLSSWS
jgi:putative photosynthetic complex assembly protein 2